MDIEIVYPSPAKRRRSWWLAAVQWSFVVTAYLCATINLLVGGKPWSLVVLWSLWFVWSLLFSRDLVEYNRISQAAKLLLNTCVLLVLIDRCLVSGWAEFVVPIVCFGSLLAIGALFFTDLSRQRQNMMPMVWLIGASLVAMLVSLSGWPAMNWPMIVLGVTAFTMLVASLIVLKEDLVREIRKHFHTR